MVSSFKRPEIIRPPSEWPSYYLPLTSGCSNNTCNFCNFYGKKLQMRDVDEVKKEIDAVARFTQHHLYTPGMPDVVYLIAREWDGKMLFLQDGDALVYPADKLEEVLRYINEKLPSVERIASYATAKDLLRTGKEALEKFKKLKLGILYIGLESGDAEILKKMEKGATPDEVIQAAKMAKEAGILTSITVILGLGGQEASQRHALETAQVLSAMDPDYVGALTLTLVPSAPLYREWQEGRFTLISPLQSLQELKTIIENSEFTNCFLSSMHASNYFSVRGTLPRDKKRMVAQLQDVIDRGPDYLRPEFLRGL
jgi:radical SAM superfamily enzyme YgiQ (UPF0313 family)